MPSKRDEVWVVRGVLSACECFSCANKIAHRFKESRVSVLCRSPCSYIPLRGEARPAVRKLTDIEQVA